MCCRVTPLHSLAFIWDLHQLLHIASDLFFSVSFFPSVSPAVLQHVNLLEQKATLGVWTTGKNGATSLWTLKVFPDPAMSLVLPLHTGVLPVLGLLPFLPLHAVIQDAMSDSLPG